VYSEGRVNDLPAYAFSPISIRARFPDSLNASPKTYFSYIENTAVVTIEGKQYKLDQWYRFAAGEIMFVRNKLYGGNTAAKGTDANAVTKPFYFTLSSVKSAASGLLGQLKVATATEYSSVLRLDLTDLVPQRAEDILNEWLACYTRAAIEDKNLLAANTLKFVEERLKYIVQDLDSVEHRVQQFKAANKVVDISAQGNLFLEGVSANDKSLAELNIKSAVLQQVEAYVVSKNSQAGIVPSTLGVSDPVLMQLLDGLYTAETQFENQKKFSGEGTPKMLGLAEQITKMRSNILENIRSQRRGLEAGKQEFTTSNNKYTALLASLPQKERELVDINRQQAIKNNIYTFLLQKREETALSAASTVADSRVVDVAEAKGSAIRSNGKMMYSMAILGALLLGIGFVSAKDMMNRTIMERKEIEKFTSVPILGEVVYDRSKSPIVTGEGKRTVIAEQFRHLRTYLGYLGINSKKKKILLTSTIPGEGKSFVTANLSISLALMGKKVVVLELDLRKPKIASLFQISRGKGITNYLIGDLSAEEIIQPTAANPNLFVVPSGPIPPNPSELLTNSRLAELLLFLEQQFDYVLIDTSPVNPVTDAFLLMPLCDATLYMVRQGHTPKAAVQKLDELYRLNGEKSMAIVFNGTQERGLINYRYGYGYGYGYGYAYAENEKKESKGKKKTKVIS
jgi:tyrosine-protein kinase Etk/Wzc